MEKVAATLSDVAKMAGVSTATCSKALRHGPSRDVKYETCERVRAAARELNYVPDASAADLGARKGKGQLPQRDAELARNVESFEAGYAQGKEAMKQYRSAEIEELKAKIAKLERT